MGRSWVKGEKSIQHFNGFICEDGTVLSVSSAAKKFGVTYARVYHAGVSIGITDEKSLKKHLVEREGRRDKIILHKTPLSEDLITDEETAKLIGITTNAFHSRVHVRGRSNLSIYKKKMPKKELDKVKEPAKKELTKAKETAKKELTKAKETAKKEPKEKEPKRKRDKKI